LEPEKLVPVGMVLNFLTEVLKSSWNIRITKAEMSDLRGTRFVEFI